MNYISVFETGNSESGNVGVLLVDLKLKDHFAEAISDHFDCEMIDYEFVSDEVDSLEDCIGGYPIDVIVELDDGVNSKVAVEISQTWLYGN